MKKKNLSSRKLSEADEPKSIEVSSDSYENSLDKLIIKAIMSAERAAVKSGKTSKSITAMESVEKRSFQFLFEDDNLEKPPLDLGTFSLEISRLISNAASLLDFKTAILNMSFSYLQNKYDQKTAEDFLNLMEDDFDMTPDEEHEDSDGQHSDDTLDVMPVHYAPGAYGGGGS